MSRRVVTLLVAVLGVAACEPAPFAPTSTVVRSTDAEEIVGQMAVAFLNRFAASRVVPAECLVDFSDACRGKRDELSDIEYNRSHFEILGARLGQPSVRLTGGGATASISMPCAFDSRITKCDTPDCRVGDLGYVAGTCLLTAVREPSRWLLCTSNFSGSVVQPTSSQFFFGPP